MATEPRDTREREAVYEVHCRECEWGSTEPIDLKGEANLRAGRHISETDHVVVVKTVVVAGDESANDDFHRGRRVSFERLRLAPGTAPSGEVRTCGPVECVVESG